MEDTKGLFFYLEQDFKMIKAFQIRTVKLDLNFQAEEVNVS